MTPDGRCGVRAAEPAVIEEAATYASSPTEVAGHVSPGETGHRPAPPSYR
ncbi:hypothetical protein ACWEPL_16410 [Nonomuraea sp. NPDC004186]